MFYLCIGVNHLIVLGPTTGMAIRIKEVNGRNYVYFIHYPEGRKVDVYCGAESRPESERRALEMEIGETRRQIADLERRLSSDIARYERVSAAARRAASGRRLKGRRGGAGAGG